MKNKFKQEFNAEIITPMFSHGNKYVKKYKIIPEIRTSEVKGLMRYVYRIASIDKEKEKLLEKEGKLFGNSERNASPIRIQMTGDISDLKYDFLRYNKPNTKNKSIPIGTTITFTLRMFQKNTPITLQDYKKLLELSLILGGIGRRTRRSRGCIATQFAKSMNIEELKTWTTIQLNRINTFISEDKIKDIQDIYKYTLKGDVIYGPKCFEEDEVYKRPVIQKIIFDKALRTTDIKKFLLAVDEASHEIKEARAKELNKEKDKVIYATGYTPNKNSKRGVFASSVIVSVVKAKDGIYPVYTFLNARYKLDKYKEYKHEDYKPEQEEFIRFIKSKREESKI